MDTAWIVAAVLAIFGVAVYSVGQVLLRGPADSDVPRRGLALMLVGGAVALTGAAIAVLHAVVGVV